MNVLIKPRILAGLVVLAVLASVLMVGRPIFASDGEVADHDDDSGAITITNEAEAVRLDAEVIAAKEGVSVDAAINVLRFQQRTADIAGVIGERYPDQFAGMVLSDGFTENFAIMLFKGEVPADLDSVVGPLGSGVSAKGGERFSLTERTVRIEAVHDALKDQGLGGYSTSFRDGVIIIRTATAYPQQAALLQRVADRVDAALGSELGGISTEDLQFMHVPSFKAVAFHAYGGDKLSGSTLCTSGFTVSHNVSFDEGVLTAAHCSGLNTYNEEGGGTFAIYYQNQHFGSNGDFEWHTTAHVDYDDFYYTTSGRRDVASVRAYSGIAVNQWVCAFGRGPDTPTTGTCSQVYAFPSDLTTSFGTAYKLIEMDDEERGPGDSGGPAYSGFEAIGLIHGGDGTHEYHSTVAKAEDQFNVTVLK